MLKKVTIVFLLVFAAVVTLLEAKLIKATSSGLHKQCSYTVDDKNKLKVIEDNAINLNIKGRDNYDNYKNPLAPEKISKLLRIDTYNKDGTVSDNPKYYLLGGDHVGKECNADGTPLQPDLPPPEYIEHFYELKDKNGATVYEKDNSGANTTTPVMVSNKIGKVESNKIYFTYPNAPLRDHYGNKKYQTTTPEITEEPEIDSVSLSKAEIDALKKREEDKESTVSKFFEYSLDVKVADGALEKKVSTGTFTGPVPGNQPNPDNTTSMHIPIEVDDVTPPSLHISFQASGTDYDGNAISTVIKIGEKVFDDLSTNKYYKIFISGIHLLKEVNQTVETGRRVYRWLNKFTIFNGGDVSDPDPTNPKMREALAFPEKQRISINIESYDNSRFRPRRISDGVTDYQSDPLTQTPGTMFYEFVETKADGTFIKKWGNTEQNPTFIILEKFKDPTNKMVFVARTKDLTGNITDITIPVEVLDQKMSSQTLHK